MQAKKSELLLQGIQANAYWLCLATIIPLAIFAYLAYVESAEISYLYWLALVAGVSLVRASVIPIGASRAWSSDAKLRFVVVAIFLSAIAQTAILSEAASLSRPLQGFIYVVFAVYCSAAVHSSNAYPPAFIAYAAPVLMALTMRVSEGQFAMAEASRFEAATICIALYGLYLWVVVKNAWKAKLALWNANDELEMLCEQLDEKARVLRAESRVKTRFLSALSYDFKLPLGQLQGLMAEIRNSSNQLDSARFALDAERVLDVQQAQFESLISMSAADSDASPKLEVSSLRSLMKRLYIDCLPAAKKRNVELVFAQYGPSRLTTDVTLLLLAMQNIVINAIQHSAGTEVVVTAEYRDGEYCFSVEDRAGGVPAEDVDSLSREFFRVRKSREEQPSRLGLGLSVVAKVCERLGLDFEISSTEGVGTRVSLQIPALANQGEHLSSLSALDIDWPSLSIGVFGNSDSVEIFSACMNRQGTEVLTLRPVLMEAPPAQYFDIVVVTPEAPVEEIESWLRCFPGVAMIELVIGGAYIPSLSAVRVDPDVTDSDILIQLVQLLRNPAMRDRANEPPKLHRVSGLSI